MIRWRVSLLLFFIAGTIIFSCRHTDPLPDSGKIELVFEHVVGEKPLVLDRETYQNPLGEDFTVTTFNYYLSNFKLIKSDGRTFTLPPDSCYFLIRSHSDESKQILLQNVPLGEYKGISFVLGVDSLKSTSPIEDRKGVLDPGGSMAEDGMYWSWNSGYIFMKMEGHSTHGNPVNNKFYYHIGLFGGYDEPTANNIRTVELSFDNEKVIVTDLKSPRVLIAADVMKIFDGPGTKLSIAEFPNVMSSQQEKSSEIADNYQKMFRFRKLL